MDWSSGSQPWEVPLDPGDFSYVWRHLGEKDAAGPDWLEARDAAQHPTVHRTAIPQPPEICPTQVSVDLRQKTWVEVKSGVMQRTTRAVNRRLWAGQGP